ncbi:TIM barrel protein [soil metagenome]
MSDLSRREALVTAVALGAATTLQAGQEPFIKNNRIKQSLCSWCFMARGEKWSLDKLCEYAAGLGVMSVELVGPKDFPTLAKHKLTCAIASTGLGFPIGFNNPVHREELTAKTIATLEAAAAAKVPSVIGFVGMQWKNPKDDTSGSIDRDTAFTNCVEGLKAVAPIAEKLGVTLCIEHLNSRDNSDPMRGHPGYQGDDLDWVCRILRKVGSPRVKLLFDVYHVQIMHGDIIRRLEECKDVLGHIHTAGNPGRAELDETQEINYPAVMKKLVSLKYAGYVGHEFIPTNKPPLEGIKQAVALCDV